jgi:hypothetical protein
MCLDSNGVVKAIVPTGAPASNSDFILFLVKISKWHISQIDWKHSTHDTVNVALTSTDDRLVIGIFPVIPVTLLGLHCTTVTAVSPTIKI